MKLCEAISGIFRLLAGDGLANVMLWPGVSNAAPFGLRGGSIANGTNSIRFYLSNRDLAANGSGQLAQNVGGRGGRSAPL